MPGSDDHGGDEDPAPLHGGGGGGGEGQVRIGRRAQWTPRPSAESPSSRPSVVRSAWPWRETRGTTALGTWFLNVGKHAYIEPASGTYQLSSIGNLSLETFDCLY